MRIVGNKQNIVAFETITECSVIVFYYKFASLVLRRFFALFYLIKHRFCAKIIRYERN